MSIKAIKEFFRAPTVDEIEGQFGGGSVLLTLLRDYETRNAHITIVCGGNTYTGRIMAGNAEVVMFQRDPWARNGFRTEFPPNNLVLAHISAVSEEKIR